MPPSRPAAVAGSGAFLVVALLLVASTLRAPLTSLPPIIGQVSDALALTPAMAGLLTGIPMLCFSLLAPPSSVLVAKAGPERAVLVGVTAILLGQLVRSGGTLPLAVAGTTLLGAGITVGNVAVPVLIARDFKSRSAAVTGAYSATMNLGSTFTTVLTVPLAALWGWQWALAGWAVLALVALVAWQRATGGRRSSGVRTSDDVARPPSSGTPLTTPAREPATLGRPMLRLTVLLCIAFAGQSSSYYAVTTWLPEILQARLGVSAGAAGGLSAPFQLCAVAGALGVPFLLSRGVRLRWVSLTMTTFWLVLPIGMLLAPAAALLWISIAGIAQGGNFTVIFMLIAQRAPRVAAARRASAVVQTTGYACAAVAPTIMGALHTATDGWTLPLLSVLAALAVMTATMAVATHERLPR